MNHQIFSTIPYRQDTHRTDDASSPVAHTPEETASRSSSAERSISARSSPGAGRFGELKIRNRSISPLKDGDPVNTASSPPSDGGVADVTQPSDFLKKAGNQESVILSKSPVPREFARARLKRRSHEQDTLSNVAQRSIHDVDNVPSAPVRSVNTPQPADKSPGHLADTSSPQHPGLRKIDDPEPHTASSDPKTTPGTSDDDTSQAHVPRGMFLQPQTHPITEDQLINEVRAIYAGLIMVEKKCIEIDKQQSNNSELLKDVQWQALIALHRTLLHEHHDFFLASNHPAASAVLRKLAEKYSMPARMWRYGIHSFLELLRKKLPGSLEHMLTFIYMAYSMITLLLESVPAFEGTWIECLGDLARYRMAVEEIDMRDRDIWSGVARYWYSKAADKSPEIGRIQHHLAVLARPNLLQQLFYYSKSLTSIQLFANARDSISLVFGPLLDSSKPVNKSNSPIMVAFVKVHGLFFTRGSISASLSLAEQFLSELDAHIGSVGAMFREQGVYIASANYAAILDYGQTDAQIPRMFDQKMLNEKPKSQYVKAARDYWPSYHQQQQTAITLREAPDTSEKRFNESDQIVSYASHLAFFTLDVILQRTGDKNILPCVHVSLAFLWCAALIPESIEYFQADVPWTRIATFLNSLIRPEVDVDEIECEDFPIHEAGSSKQLPEDFLIRGLAWSQLYYPEDFFLETADDEERSIELPSVIVPRTRRCLWLGLKIANLGCWIKYNQEKREFYATSFANELAHLAGQHQVIGKGSTEQRDTDTNMTDV